MTARTRWTIPALLTSVALAAGCDPLLPPEADLLDGGSDGGALLLDGGVPDGSVASDSGIVLEPDGGIYSYTPPDSGVVISGEDAGVTEADAGTPESDGGPERVDAGGRVPDAGHEVDAGLPEVDAGLPEVDAGLPEVDAGQPAPVGSGCGANADCASGNCYTQSPGGYCTQTCGQGCPSGSACDYGLGGYCVQSCTANSDCRDGYSCQFQLGGNICLEAMCQFNFQCGQGTTCSSDSNCPSYETCDTGHGYCTP